MEKSESYVYEIGKMKFIVTPVYKNEGETIYDILPEQFSEIVSDFIIEGASIIGGCCGTTPEHIKLLVQKTKENL